MLCEGFSGLTWWEGDGGTQLALTLGSVALVLYFGSRFLSKEGGAGGSRKDGGRWAHLSHPSPWSLLCRRCNPDSFGLQQRKILPCS